MRYVLQLNDGSTLDVLKDADGCYTIVDGPCPQCAAPLRVVGRGTVTGFGTGPETICGSEFRAHCRACNNPIGVLHGIDTSLGAA